MPPQPKPMRPANAFFGDDIVAQLQLDPNERFVPLRRLCEALGLDAAPQARRAREHTVLAEGLRNLVVEDEGDGKPEPCLRVDLIPLWLVGVDARKASAAARERLETLQRECASVLWQIARPQGFGTDDVLLPPAHQQNPAEQGYVGAQAQANLARQQLLIERQIEIARMQRDDQAAALGGEGAGIDDPAAVTLAQAVRRVATTLGARTHRNEYGGAFSGLHRQFGISSYRRMPRGRLHEAMEWLERWYGDLLGEPEPPPDI